MRDYDFYTRELTFTIPDDDSAAFTMHDTEGFTELSFILRANTTGYDLVVENQAGELYRAAIGTGEAEYGVDVSDSTSLRVVFSLREGISQRGEVVLRYQEDSLR